MNSAPPESFREQIVQRDDEIDIVEVLGFIIRIRLPILIGAVVGLFAGFVYTQTYIKQNFSSKVSVTLEVSSLPAMTDSKKVIDAYQGALGSPELAAVAFRKMLAAAPEFGKSLAEKGFSLNDLVSAQTLSDKPADAPLRLSPSTSVQDFVIQASFVERGLGRKAGELLLMAINEVAREYNSRALRIHDESVKNMVQQSTQALQTVQGNSEEERIVREKELNQVQTELARIEYQLGKLGRGLPLFERFVLLDAAQNQSSAISSLMFSHSPKLKSGEEQSSNGFNPNFTNSTELNVVRGIRMIAALEEEARINSEQALKYRTQLAKLQGRFVKESSLHSTVTSASKWALAGLYESMARSVVPIDRSNLFLPMFRFNTEIYTDDLADRSFEVSSSKARFMLILFLMFGSLAGGFLAAMRIFFVKNRAKFRSLSHEDDSYER